MNDAPTPNPQQQRLVEGTEGVYLVDASAGTGKTFAITRRYANIVDRPDIEPEDVLLVTFTRSGATEMKERIVGYCDYEMRELANAPIQTFHAHCNDLLGEFGADAPGHLGIDERITGSTEVVDDELIETELFDEFLGQFRAGHPEHVPLFRAIDDLSALLDLVKQLAAKGVFPTESGWYRDSEAHLDGDFDAFQSLFETANRPRNNGRKQSPLREDLSRYDSNRTYEPDAPAKSTVRGDRGSKQVPPEVAPMAFEADRERLKTFVHDLYFEYLTFALSRNYLTFGFLQLFAFVLLCEDPAVRERADFQYVMVDEFQDTSEIQFKLALLLTDTDNLCAVGDWRQSIYAFQYADVRNITDFESRLETFAAQLNDDATRVSLSPGAVEAITFVENYRSTETVLDLAADALRVPATDGETVEGLPVEEGQALSATDTDGHGPSATDTAGHGPSATDTAGHALSANAAFDNTQIRARQHEDEPETVCALVQEVVGNDEYAVEDENGDPRPPDYRDIAVFTRTRAFGRDLLDVAESYGLPMAYDGGVELFRTDPAKLLLAWLRILEADADRGWAVVLERAGYTLDEIDHLLAAETVPEDLSAFAASLRGLETVGALARHVFDRYGVAGSAVDALLHAVQSLHDSTTYTRGELIRFLERAIEQGAVRDVQTSGTDDAVTVQTIHAAKGLEYPIVILANMNEGAFPPRSSDSSVVQYRDPVGLRQRKRYAESGPHPHVYDNWRYEVLRRALPRDYDEERRLLYVAITRAEQHVLFTAGENPNAFLEELPVPVESVEPDVEQRAATEWVQTELPFTVRPPTGPVGHTPHSLMDESVFEDAGESMEGGTDPRTGERGGHDRGLDRGSRVHAFAEAYARGESVSPSDDDERAVAALLDDCSAGTLHVEEPVTLPLTVGDQRVAISGVADLVHETPEAVEIIDYKTDRTRRAQSEYRLQVSVYYHVLADWFEGRDVTASLFYTREDERVAIAPLSLDELRAVVDEELGAR